MLGLSNLIINGSFNAWAGAASDPPDNWTAELTATLLREANTAPIISDYHIKITAVGAADEGIEIAGGTANYLKVKPSTVYTFSIYYKASAGDEAGIKITSFNGAAAGTAHVDVELTETGWTRYYVTFTTDADADNLQIQLLAANDTDIVYFCGDMLVEGDSAWAYTPNRADGGGGDMLKSIYDTDGDGRVDKAESVDDGTNVSTAANVKDAVDKKHTQGTDTSLGTQSENLDMNTNKIVNVTDPDDPQDGATKQFVLDNVGGGPIVGPVPLFGDGSDGTPDFSSGGNITTYIKQYASLTIPEGQTVVCDKEITIIVVEGTCTIAGTLTAAEKGGALTKSGGLGLGGKSSERAASEILLGGAGGGGGGGGGVSDDASGGGSGGYGGGAGGIGGDAGALDGGYGGGANGGNGAAPLAVKIAVLLYGDRMQLGFAYGGGGANGGAGKTRNASSGGAAGAGGVGGGAIIIICKELVFTGTIDTSGEDGTVGVAGVSAFPDDSGGGGGGGAGGGGNIVILADTITTNTGTATKAGGSGGAGGAAGGGGAVAGDGGDGGDGYTGISQIEEI